MKRLFLALLIGTATVIQGCAGNVGNLNHTPVVDSVGQLPMGRAGVFIYREDEPLNPAAINVYVDGDYFTSLQKNHYRYTDLCPGQHTWNAVYHYADPAYYEKLHQAKSFALAEDRVVYLKVSANASDEIELTASSSEEVENVLGHLHLQSHTISRVTSAQACR